MKDLDRKDYIERYEGRLRQHGYSPETLGWGRSGRQEVRFSVLAEEALRHQQASVLDAGCGFGDLYGFLHAAGWRGRYTGVDIVPGLLAEGRARHPDADFRELDITDPAAVLEPSDYVIASGVFNARLRGEDNLVHIEKGLQAMVRLAKVAVCVDFMSTYVDFQKPEGWHTDPAWAFQAAMKLKKRVLLRHDYMPFEFALIIYVQDALSPRRVFAGYEERLAGKLKGGTL